MGITIKEIDVKSVMTKSNLPVSDYSVNPYVGCSHACKYCYASFMKRFTNHPEPWGEFIDVKMWPEIKKPEKYADKEAFLGSVTDCYQPCEAKYKRTRALLEQLQGSGISISIATKSDLVLRDIDLIKTFPNARVSWSINTLDEDFRILVKVAQVDNRHGMYLHIVFCGRVAGNDMEGGGERHPGEPPRTLGQLVPKLGKQKTPARKNTTQAHKVRRLSKLQQISHCITEYTCLGLGLFLAS